MDAENRITDFAKNRGYFSALSGENLSPAGKRILGILDQESFMEINTFLIGHDERGREIIAGAGTVDRRPVYIYSQDTRFNGGMLSEQGGKKVLALLEQARNTGTPLIGILGGAGVQVEDGAGTLRLLGSLYSGYSALSGVVPLVTFLAGPCPGSLSFIAGLSDFVAGTRGLANLYLNSPGAIKGVSGEEVSLEDIGGAAMHFSQSGIVQLLGEDEGEVCGKLRELIGYLPLNCLEEAPGVPGEDDPDRASPRLGSQVFSGTDPYEARDIIREIADNQVFLELQEAYAPNLVAGFIRLNGSTTGVLANQPGAFSGCLDCDAAAKGASFIKVCDSFNIPLLTLVDVPGFLPTANQEQRGIVRQGARLMQAYARAGIPRVTLVISRAHGPAGVAMGSKALGVDQVLAWPTAEVGIVSSAGLASLVGLPEQEAERVVSAYAAASRGLVDDIIEPGETRSRLVYTLEFLKNKRRGRAGHRSAPCRCD